MTKEATYCRVSTDNQEREGHTDLKLVDVISMTTRS